MLPKLVMFDLDNTLAESKQPLAPLMGKMVGDLLAHTKVAVVSGGALPQFLTQVIAQLPAGTHLENLYLLPTSGAALYEYVNGEWTKIYEERITESDAAKIEMAIEDGANESGVIDRSLHTYGPRLEYRGGEVTYSALGQLAPPPLKKAWDPDHSKRGALQAAITKHLPQGFEAKMGGATSIDITKVGIDKAYGIHQLAKRLGIEESDTLYVGDELVANGNDEAVFKTAAKTHAVGSPSDTALFIRALLSA